MSHPDYRFEIAISFAGDKKRDLVRKVAELLREKVGEGKVFFDEWFESEIAGHDAQTVLQNYYTKKTRLVVTCVCQRYNEKPWTQDEWRAIQAFERDLRDASNDNIKRMRLLPLRFGDGDIDGLFRTAVVPDVRNRAPEEIAELILKRLERAKQESAKQETLSPSTTAAPRTPALEDILALQERIKKIRVDRDEEKQLFRDLVTKRSPVRALLIEAESGMGKSRLIEDFMETDASFLHALVDFKNASLTFGDVLFSIRRQLGSHNFQAFETVCRYTLQQGQAPQLPTLLGSQVDGVLLRAPSDEIRDHQMRQIFEAFSSDLVALAKSASKPVVVIIDTFERASDGLKKWIARELVPRISSAEDVIWIIAGRQTPSIEFSGVKWLLEQRLKPLASEYRREYLKQINVELAEVLIKFIMEQSKGKPKDLQTLAMTAIRI